MTASCNLCKNFLILESPTEETLNAATKREGVCSNASHPHCLTPFHQCHSTSRLQANRCRRHTVKYACALPIAQPTSNRPPNLSTNYLQCHCLEETEIDQRRPQQPSVAAANHHEGEWSEAVRAAFVSCLQLQQYPDDGNDFLAALHQLSKRIDFFPDLIDFCHCQVAGGDPCV